MGEQKNQFEALSFLNPSLLEEIKEKSNILEIPTGTEIIRYGQYIKAVPILIKGLVKVFTRHDEKELLLYYIKPGESCIMSFSASLNNTSSQIIAITEEDSSIMMLPATFMPNWTRLYPDMNHLFFQQYNLRYNELLETINHLLFDRMDKRLYDFLKARIALTQKQQLKISHKQIANELGTAREVVSRVMKKLESEGKVRQHNHNIELL